MRKLVGVLLAREQIIGHYLEHSSRDNDDTNLLNTEPSLVESPVK